jgi:hypothetical protein
MTSIGIFSVRLCVLAWLAQNEDDKLTPRGECVATQNYFLIAVLVHCVKQQASLILWDFIFLRSEKCKCCIISNLSSIFESLQTAGSPLRPLTKLHAVTFCS